MFSAIIQNVADALYTANVEFGYCGSGNEYSSETAVYGYGFYFMWVTSGIMYASLTPYDKMVQAYKEINRVRSCNEEESLQMKTNLTTQETQV